MKIKRNIQILIRKLEKNTITSEEMEEFLTLVKDKNNKTLFDQILDNDLKKLSMEVISTPDVDRNRIRWIIPMSIAAAVLILVLAAFIFNNVILQANLTFSTSVGETLKVELPDESIVTLNANSTLTWIDKNQNIREARLSGEAFFDVRHQDNVPFRVYSDNLVIDVLGTEFNVNNRQGAGEIYLKEGEIQVSNNRVDQAGVLLTTGESAYVDTETYKLVKTKSQKLEDQSLWRDGILKFTDTPVKNILKQVEDIYGVKLTMLDDELMKRPMDFALPYTNWEMVSEGLALALGKELVKYDDFYELK